MKSTNERKKIYYYDSIANKNIINGKMKLNRVDKII
jgi:hypothetical protein